MRYDVGGTWCGTMTGPAGNLHDFKLVLDQHSHNITARLSAVKHGPDKRRSDLNFDVNVQVCGKFLALLSKDGSGLGLNAMVLEVLNDTQMKGRIIWNSITRGTVDQETIEFSKSI